jgi:hypothetical protein
MVRMPVLRKLRILLVLTITVVVLPALILAVSAVVLQRDEKVGFHRYSLPMPFLLIYLAAVLIVPITGIASLITLRSLRKREPDKMTERAPARLRTCVVVTSIFAILSDSVWLYYFSTVFFATGFSR